MSNSNQHAMYVDFESVFIYYNYTNGERVVCICNKGYYWSIILRKCLPLDNICSLYNPCGSYRGKCIRTNYTETNPYYYKCSCSPGFTGKFCEININPCSVPENYQKCFHPFNCIRDTSESIRGFRCECEAYPGYAPASIHDPKCVNINECNTYMEVCKNGGICKNNVTGSFTCECSEGFYGQHCDR